MLSFSPKFGGKLVLGPVTITICELFKGAIMDMPPMPAGYLAAKKIWLSRKQDRQLKTSYSQ